MYNGQTDREQIRSRINATDAGHFGRVRLSQLHTKTGKARPKHPASVVIDSALYLLSKSSPDIDNVAMSPYDSI